MRTSFARDERPPGERNIDGGRAAREDTNMTTRARRLFAMAQAIGLSWATAAHAATLYTPVTTVPGGHWAYCWLTNVGTSPIQATATVITSTGFNYTQLDSCSAPPGTVDPGTSCYALSGPQQLNSMYCKFTTSSSRVRATLQVVDAVGNPVISVQATK
jgi:hypothetical protein